MEAIVKKRLFFLIKLIITSLILFFLFRRIDFAEVYSLVIQLNLSVFLLLIISSIIKLYIQYKNWQTCLSINQAFLPKSKDIIKTLLIGSALRFLIPGGHATYGKAYFLDNSIKGSLISITMEKFMLTWTVLFYGSWAALFYFSNYSITLKVVVLIIITTFPLLVYHGKFLFRNNSQYFDSCLKIVPSITIFQGFFIFFTVYQYYIIINQFQLLDFSKALISIPLILTANIIPVTYSGLGLRETFAMYILNDFSIKPEVAVTSSLLIFFINSLIPALIGGYLILTTKKKMCFETD